MFLHLLFDLNAITIQSRRALGPERKTLLLTSHLTCLSFLAHYLKQPLKEGFVYIPAFFPKVYPCRTCWQYIFLLVFMHTHLSFWELPFHFEPLSRSLSKHLAPKLTYHELTGSRLENGSTLMDISVLIGACGYNDLIES